MLSLPWGLSRLLGDTGMRNPHEKQGFSLLWEVIGKGRVKVGVGLQELG